MTQIISDYIKLKRTESTKTGTRVSLKKFLNWKYQTDYADVAELEPLAARYLNEYSFQDILDYIVWLRDDCKYQPKSISQYSKLVVGFLEHHDITVTVSQRATMINTMPRVVAVTQDRPFTKSIIQTMCSHSGVMLRTIILLATSSGMRINEVINLEYSEIEWGNPNKIRLPRTKMKQGKPHTYRFSSEAADSLREWLKVRDEYERRSIMKTHQNLRKEKKERGSFIFPVTATPIYNRWRKMLEDAGLNIKDSETGFSLYSTHGCRRWFSSTASKYIQHEIAEALIGHDSGLSSSYRRYPEEDLDREYLKLESHLFIFAPSDYSEMKGEMAEALKEQMSTTAQLAATVLTLHEKLEAMELYIKATKAV